MSKFMVAQRLSGSIDELESVKLKLIHPALPHFDDRYVVVMANRV
jgi:hypothetical protein